MFCWCAASNSKPINESNQFEYNLFDHSDLSRNDRWNGRLWSLLFWFWFCCCCSLIKTSSILLKWKHRSIDRQFFACSSWFFALFKLIKTAIKRCSSQTEDIINVHKNKLMQLQAISVTISVGWTYTALIHSHTHIEKHS